MASTYVKFYWDLKEGNGNITFRIPNDKCRIVLDDLYNNLYGLIMIWGCKFSDVTVKGNYVDIEDIFDKKSRVFKLQYERKSVRDKLCRAKYIHRYYSTYLRDGCIGDIMRKNNCDVIIEPCSGRAGSTEFPSFSRIVIERRGSYGVKKVCDIKITDETRISGFDTESGEFCSLKPHCRPRTYS